MTKSFYINKCIYCGGKGETDEHIIPFALGGTKKLIKASCESCRDITSRCERNPLSENWAEVRAVLDYPSRHRDFSGEKFVFEVTFKSGVEGVLELSKNETIGIASFLEYPLPAFFAPDNYKNGVVLSAYSLISFGSDLKALAEKYDLKTIGSSFKHKGNNFEKMVVKIAYCASVAFLGLDSFEQRLVLPAILGEKDDVGFWIGCDPEGRISPIIGKQGVANVIKIGVCQKAGDKKRYIVARLKFFASSDAPEYIVVVGTLKPNFVITAHQEIPF